MRTRQGAGRTRRDSDGRADLQVIVPDLGVDTTIDFVITTEHSRAQAIARKARKYKGLPVVTAEATILGGVGAPFAKLIRSVTTDSGRRRELHQLLSKTIQSMNGKILQRRNPQPLSIREDPESSDAESVDQPPRPPARERIKVLTTIPFAERGEVAAQHVAAPNQTISGCNVQGAEIREVRTGVWVM